MTFLFFNLFYCCLITVVRIFSTPLPPTPSKPTSLSCFHSPPWFCPCVLYSSSWKPFSPLSPLSSPLAIVRLFLTSMTLVIFCLLFSFADYVPVRTFLNGAKILTVLCFFSYLSNICCPVKKWPNFSKAYIPVEHIKFSLNSHHLERHAWH